jgi:hypothetical protein
VTKALKNKSIRNTRQSFPFASTPPRKQERILYIKGRVVDDLKGIGIAQDITSEEAEKPC